MYDAAAICKAIVSERQKLSAWPRRRLRASGRKHRASDVRDGGPRRWAVEWLLRGVRGGPRWLVCCREKLKLLFRRDWRSSGRRISSSSRELLETDQQDRMPGMGTPEKRRIKLKFFDAPHTLSSLFTVHWRAVSVVQW